MILEPSRSPLPCTASDANSNTGKVLNPEKYFQRSEGRLLQGEPTRDQQQRLHHAQRLAEKENTGARRPVAVQTVTGRQAWS